MLLRPVRPSYLGSKPSSKPLPSQFSYCNSRNKICKSFFDDFKLVYKNRRKILNYNQAPSYMSPIQEADSYQVFVQSRFASCYLFLVLEISADNNPGLVAAFIADQASLRCRGRSSSVVKAVLNGPTKVVQVLLT